MNNFRKINIKFIEKLAYRRREYTSLFRIISGYANTQYRLFRMGVVDFPACSCGFLIQDLNLFWACPILDNQRKKLYHSLKICKFQSPFSVEYLLDNINKRIASIICNFVLKIGESLNIKM